MSNAVAEKQSDKVKSEKELTGSVKELVEIGQKKEIMLYDQQRISEEVIGEDVAWYKLDEEQARKVSQAIAARGYTDLLNNATGQTDILDEAEAPQSLTVLDEETGKMVKVDADKRQLANSLQQGMDVATLMTAVVMKRMADEKLYLAVDKGYSSFREYAETRCPFGYRQAQKYAAIGRKFAPMLPDHFNNSLQGTNSSSPQQESLDGNLEALGEIGVTKLYELSQIEDADFTELPSEGKVTLKDGTELDLEEIKGQSARAFKDKIQRYKQYQEELEVELNSTANARDKALAEKEEIAKEAEIGMKYKDMYGQKSDQFEAFKSRMMTARAKAADLNQALSKVKDMPAEFESLTDELQNLHAMIDRGLQRLREDNLESGAFSTLSNHN